MRLKATTSSEANRRKASQWAGFASVTVRLGRSISSKERYSIDQNTLPQAWLSAATVP